MKVRFKRSDNRSHRKKNNRNSRNRRKKSSSVSDVLWQFAGLLTIIVVISVFVFGDSYQVAQSEDNSLLDKPLSEVLISLDSRY